MTAPPFLLVGGGMLAVDLVAATPDGVRLVALDHAALDVTDAKALGDVLDRVRPSAVINTAAFTRVDDAEREREAAWRVNADGPGIIGAACVARGLGVVHFSTDYVFDGASGRAYAEDATPAPVNFYGESKLAGERALEATGARALIVRTQWLYGTAGRSFCSTMWERAHAGLETRVVNDQTGRPTSAASLARKVWRLLQADASGTLHLANRGVATWHDVAERIFAAAGASHLLSACTTADYPTAARRPSYSVLDTSRVESQAGIWMVHWTEALDQWIAERRVTDTSDDE